MKIEVTKSIFFKIYGCKKVFLKNCGCSCTIAIEGSVRVLGFQNCGCRLSDVLYKTKDKGAFFMNIEVTQSIFLKTCGCSCTHFTHINEGSDIYG